MKKFFRSIAPLFSILLFAAALWVLNRELSEYHYQDIINHIGEISGYTIALALALTVAGYLVATGLDALSLRYVRHPLDYGRVVLVSFLNYAFNNNMGFAGIAGSSIRYRLYSAWGLSAVEVAKVIAFCILTSWLGFFSLGGVVFLFEPMSVPGALHLPIASVRPLGMVFLLLVVGYLLGTVSRKKPLKIGKWEFAFPPARLFPAQIAIASLDWALAGSVLYVLLPSTETISFPVFIAIFLFAQSAGLVSHVPGGIGVFESVVLVLLSSSLPASVVIGPLLVYRVMYYLLPLAVAALLLGVHEVARNKEGVKQVTSIFGQWVPWLVPNVLVPNVLAVTTFVSGAILLLSGATPAVPWRLEWLNSFLPLPMIEISHFLGSITGMGLLILARGIQRRLGDAYILTLCLLGAGIVFSLFKGLDYEEAIALAIILGALLPCRRYFYRKASLLSGRFTPGWIAAIIIVLSGVVWLGMFSYKHVEFSQELWWRFILSGDASRSLRATACAISIALFYATARLLRPAQPKLALPGPEELNRARTIIKRSRKTYPNLALLGDKTFLWSENKNAFIMYGIEGRSWVAMGDPVGSAEEMAELVWQFHEMCERSGGRTVFYEVGQENLHLYLDLGLTVTRIGEEARIPLATFSLEGHVRKRLRYTKRRLESERCSFEVIPQACVPPILHQLKGISDAWLAHKNTREHKFSSGFFNAEYLKQFPVAVVRMDGRIVAFANIWQDAGKEELSIDLMRYLPDTPHGIMDYLFIELMLWGKRDGYRWFNLGMAPLSGLTSHSLVPRRSRLGAFIFSHGDHFYNFQGLREYKEKFDPEWETKYMAYPGDLELPRILVDLASLI